MVIGLVGALFGIFSAIQYSIDGRSFSFITRLVRHPFLCITTGSLAQGLFFVDIHIAVFTIFVCSFFVFYSCVVVHLLR